MGAARRPARSSPITPSAKPARTDCWLPRQIGNTEVMFASEADFLKADKAFREQVEVQNVPSLGGLGSSGGTKAGCALEPTQREAVAGFLQGRNIRHQLEDLQDYLDVRRPLQTSWISSPTASSMPS